MSETKHEWRQGVKTCDFCGKVSADIAKHPCFIAEANGVARMKEELIKKVKEKRDRAHARFGIVRDARNALDELAVELEKVEIK